MTINWVIIFATVLVSLLAFKKNKLYYGLMFSPYNVVHKKQWYTLFTSAFIHDRQSIFHLLFNMYVLYSFGTHLLYYLDFVHTLPSTLVYLLLYFGGIVFSSLPTLVKHKNNLQYRALGASGAVSAIVFASIVFSPLKGGVGIIFIPSISLPPIIFGGLYLTYEIYMSRQGKTNISHDAHIYGSVYGFMFSFLFLEEARTSFFNQFMGLIH